ncbi:Transducin/WD40 repeat-like superfamily protein [Zea mays]|uniref:Transducin/WD40 repeat-like superfamily protein n=1 Tax=Zea mays TaxID=4577 RepID=A0A1D6HR53_MAIZE|nr:Transducin/WD40 repeat-like superfamily protein [Zea mays]ONM50994.1 Transducin/WD40 repeat-like superfamily protein [Zea mays]
MSLMHRTPIHQFSEHWWLLLDLENLVPLYILWIFLKLLTWQSDHGLPTEFIHLIEQCGQLIVVLMAHMQLSVRTLVLV